MVCYLECYNYLTDRTGTHHQNQNKQQQKWEQVRNKAWKKTTRNAETKTKSAIMMQCSCNPENIHCNLSEYSFYVSSACVWHANAATSLQAGIYITVTMDSSFCITIWMYIMNVCIYTHTSTHTDTLPLLNLTYGRKHGILVTNLESGNFLKCQMHVSNCTIWSFCRNSSLL